MNNLHEMSKRIIWKIKNNVTNLSSVEFAYKELVDVIEIADFSLLNKMV